MHSEKVLPRHGLSPARPRLGISPHLGLHVNQLNPHSTTSSKQSAYLQESQDFNVQYQKDDHLKQIMAIYNKIKCIKHRQ